MPFIETATAGAATGKVVEKTLQTVLNKVEKPLVSNIERLSSDFKDGTLTDADLTDKIKTAANGASQFFGFSEQKFGSGNELLAQMKDCDLFKTDVKSLFKLEQFKDIKSMSFEDMSKLWSHNCGQQVMSFCRMNAWAKQLGTDFLMGARSQVLGLSNGKIEKALGESKGSLSQPPGNLRTEAIQKGREAVQECKQNNIPITMPTLRDMFCQSDLAKIKVGDLTDVKSVTLSEDKALRAKEIKTANDNKEYFSREAEQAKKIGDESRANELQSNAEEYKQQVEKLEKVPEKTDLQQEPKDVLTSEQTEKHLMPKTKGHWEKDVDGNDVWIPDDNEPPTDRNKSNPKGLLWKQIKQMFHFKGITFKNGYPDFAPFSKGTVEIDNFSIDRSYNFAQADQKLAEQLTKESKTGRIFSAEDVSNWRSENNYTWHEMEDCKTMQKVPREVHGNISHEGGIAKMKQLLNAN